jgi:5-methyltetrahydropteroyltriglutamate--homocysteine methyltransferase
MSSTSGNGWAGWTAPAKSGSRAPDVERFPEHMAAVTGGLPSLAACTGDVSYRDLAPLHTEIGNLRHCLHAAGRDGAEAFLSAASPGVIAAFTPNQHYPTYEQYVQALAAAMKTEYDAVHAAGLILQIDAPDLAFLRDSAAGAAAAAVTALHVKALNHATRDIPPQAMRLHVCWGNAGMPHTGDVPLRDIIRDLLQARPAGLCVGAANPRHAHEWNVFEDVVLPAGKYLVAGVIDTTTPIVEHPDLVAERLLRYAALIGPDRLIAGTDCGFASFAAMTPVPVPIVAAKLDALAEGAARASRALYPQAVTATHP